MNSVQELIDIGFALVPLLPGKKNPGDDGWQTRPYAVEDFTESKNIGGKCGEPSGWRVDCDLDVPEAIQAADALLPHTGLVHGRRSKPRSHRWLIAQGCASKTYKDLDGSMLLELRSTGGQTMLPTSTHPSGERVEWESTGAPLEMQADALTSACDTVAIATLLGRHWPQGSRHLAAGAVAGFLARLDIQPLIIEQIVKVAATIAGDEEVQDRVRFAAETVAKHQKGGKVTGGPRMAESFADAEKLVARISTWLGKDDDKVVERLNERWFVVDVGTETVVGEEVTEKQDGRTWTTLSFRSFEDFRKKLVKESHVQRGKRSQSAADYWLQSPRGRQYNQLVYAPTGSGLVVGPNDLDGWRGFTVEPKAGTWAKNKAHILNVICGGDETVFAWVLDWCAALFQAPGRHAETALVLIGGQGTGKGHFADVMLGQSFDGRHNRSVTNQKRVFGDFNDILSGLCLLFLDEAGLNKPEHVAAAKSLITSHTLDINRKHIKIASERSMLHVIIASNDKNPIAIEPDDRRYCILRVSDARKKDLKYFADLHDELQHGGRAAMIFELQHREITSDLRNPPSTAAKRDAKRRTWTPVQAFLAQMIETTTREGWTNGGKSSERRINKRDTVDSYRDYRQRANVNGTLLDPQRELHDAIRDHVPAEYKFNRVVKEKSEGTRDYWTLPAYGVFRASFAKARGIEVDDLADPNDADDRLPFEELKADERQQRIEAAVSDVVAIAEVPEGDQVPELQLVGRRADGRPVFVVRFVEGTAVTQE